MDKGRQALNDSDLHSEIGREQGCSKQQLFLFIYLLLYSLNLSFRPFRKLFNIKACLSSYILFEKYPI